MATGTLAPAIFQQYSDANGAPLAGGKIGTYLAGTTTPTPVYTDAGLTTQHTNPVVLNAAGRLPAGGAMFLATLSYKFTLSDANDVLIDTIDNVQAVGVSTAQLGEVFSFGGDSSALITNTAYPAGATLDKTHPGTGVYHADSADIPAGTYVLEALIQGIGGATLTAALVNLSDGAPDTPLVEIAGASATGGRVQGANSITFAAPGSAKDYAIKSKIDAGAGHGGLAWAFKLRRTA
jgi:hypothetical protein